MIYERIETLRKQRNLTQAELAKILGITRSGVNAWEMGISVPSTQYIVELARFFDISSDYLLGIDRTATLDLSGLTDSDMEILHSLKEHLKHRSK